VKQTSFRVICTAIGNFTSSDVLHREKAGQRQSIKIGNRSFESVAKFKYLGITLTDQNCIHEEIKSRLNSGNACYHSVQSLLSSRLLSRNVKVKISIQWRYSPNRALASSVEVP
jgi:hypothetical protein